MIKLIAEDGMRITTNERIMFVEKICLPVTANIDVFEEVGRDVWKHFIEEENPDIIELQHQNKDINDTLDIVMTAVASIDEQNSAAIDVILLAIDELYTMMFSALDEGGE